MSRQDDWRTWLDAKEAEALEWRDAAPEGTVPTMVVSIDGLIRLIRDARALADAHESIVAIAPHTSVAIDLAHPAEISTQALESLGSIRNE